MSYFPLKADTFVPTVTLVGGAGNVVPVYTTNSGRYQKVGNRVFVEIFLDGNGGAAGAGTGAINIALPLAASANQTPDFIIAGHFHNGANEHIAFAQVSPSGTITELFIQSAITTTRAATGADQNNATRTIKLNFWYEVSS